MRVVLLGEFSGFHGALRDGLRTHGIDVDLVGTRDGSKALPVDVDIGSQSKGYLTSRTERMLRSLWYVSTMSDADVVQMVNPTVFLKGAFNELLVSRVQRKTRKLFLSACGTDAFYVRNKDQLRYNPIDDNVVIDLKTANHPLTAPSAQRWNQKLASIVDGVIPVMYDYQVAYTGHDNLLPTIPLPVNTDAITYQEPSPAEKIVILHGITRLGFKGSHHILRAFEDLSERFPNDLEFIVVKNMPLEAYKQQLRRAHVVVDQTSSYSCGMNALIALAMGKLVLGGAEPESLSGYGVDNCPVINILPNHEDVSQAIVNLLDLKKSIGEISYEGRLFVEKHHEYKMIAQKYISSWSS